jgi:hypothetical protein
LVHPSSELLIAKVEFLLAGVETRASIAAWAKSQISTSPGVGWQIGTLASVELRMPGAADSYVIRDIDLRELLGDLRREPPETPSHARVAPLRSWQVRPGIMQALTLDAPLREIARRVGLDPIRCMEDGLGPGEVVAFALPSGGQVVIFDFWGGNRELSVHLDLDSDDPRSQLEELLHLFELTPDCVTWRSPDLLRSR